MVAIESNFGLVVVRASRSRFAASALVKRLPRLVAGPGKILIGQWPGKGIKREALDDQPAANHRQCCFC